MQIGEAIDARDGAAGTAVASLNPALPSVVLRRKLRPLLAVGLASAALVTTFYGQPADLRGIGSIRPAKASGEVALSFDPEKMAVSNPGALKALAPEAAYILNTQRPVSKLPNLPARSLIVSRTDDLSYRQALDCMTSAIYYEAGSESLDGQRAVAQVVLNRVRHPGYPNTICGVVFQGSQLSTGCQFTFTCDGALSRVPNAAAWARARDLGRRALAGFVYKPVGLSTHYHADYVMPYWADSLVKISSIGTHIFYRLDGALGRSSAFGQHYGGHEPRPFARVADGSFALTDPPAFAAGMFPLRPILDSTGRAVRDGRTAPVAPGSVGAGADNSRGAKLADVRMGSAGAAISARSARPRWIIGMDGAPQPDRSSNVVERPVNKEVAAQFSLD